MTPPIGFPRLLACVALSGVLLPAAVPCFAQDVGRLFFSPQQRQELDRRRNTNVVDAKPAAAAEGPVTVNGHISRSSGKTTTWINGVPQYDTYRSRDAARVPVDGGDRIVPVKVGETLDRGRGAVTDELQGGSVKVTPGGKR